LTNNLKVIHNSGIDNQKKIAILEIARHVVTTHHGPKESEINSTLEVEVLIM